MDSLSGNRSCIHRTCAPIVHSASGVSTNRGKCPAASLLDVGKRDVRIVESLSETTGVGEEEITGADVEMRRWQPDGLALTALHRRRPGITGRPETAG